MNDVAKNPEPIRQKKKESRREMRKHSLAKRRKLKATGKRVPESIYETVSAGIYGQNLECTIVTLQFM
jgi:hypothetical protein